MPADPAPSPGRRYEWLGSTRFALCRRDALTALFRGGGLGDVRCDSIAIPTVFASFDDCWHPLRAGTGPAPSCVASLGAHRRARLAQTLEGRLRRGPEDGIALTARAWAVRGTVSRRTRIAWQPHGVDGATHRR